MFDDDGRSMKKDKGEVYDDRLLDSSIMVEVMILIPVLTISTTMTLMTNPKIVQIIDNY